LVLGASGEIATITSLTATNIYGSIKTAAQPSITSLGTLSGLITKAAGTTSNISLMSDYALALMNQNSTNGEEVGLCFGISSNAPNAYAGGASIVHRRVDTNSAGGLRFNIRNSPVAADPLVEAFRVNSDASTTFNYPMTIDSNLVFSGSSRAIIGLSSISATTLTGTLSTAAQTAITSVGTLSNLTLSTGGTGLQIPNLKIWNATTSLYDNFNHTYYLSVVEGGCVASKALVVDSNKDIGSIRNLSCTGAFTTSTSISTPSLTTDTITKAGTQTMSATTLNINPTTLQIRGTTLSSTATELNALSGLTATSTELNYSDITTLGSFQSGKVMTLEATSGVGLMPLGTAATYCLRFFGGTAFKETMNLYRDSDSSGLTIASRTSGTSINKTYPLLKLVSTIDPSNLGTGSGVAAQNADLMQIVWNDKPTTGFASQTHRFCFDIGATRPYKSGIPQTFTLATSGDAFAINVAGSTPNPTSDCLYIVSDTINKMLYNTNTPYTNASFGTANITFNDSTLYIKSSHDLNDGTANYDMPLFITSSNASPIEVGIQIHNGAKATAANAAIIGTTTANDFGIMTNNSRRMTIKSTGLIGIGTSSPSAPLHITSNVSYTWNSLLNVGITVYRLRTDSGVTESGGGGNAITYTNVAALFSGYIGCEAMVMQSDRRLKQDIADVPIGRVECLYKSLSVKSYHWKAHPDKFKELGLIAQDVLDQGFIDLVAKIPDSDPELEQSNDPWLEPKGVKLHVDYSKLAVYNMRMIQGLLDQITELNNRLSIIETSLLENGT